MENGVPSSKISNLETVFEAKYIGVTIISRLLWNICINTTSSKANRSLGFLRRNFKVASTKMKTEVFFALFRPLLEKSSTVWDPYAHTQIYKLEIIQRIAGRYVLYCQHDVSNEIYMLQTFG